MLAAHLARAAPLADRPRSGQRSGWPAGNDVGLDLRGPGAFRGALPFATAATPRNNEEAGRMRRARGPPRNLHPPVL